MSDEFTLLEKPEVRLIDFMGDDYSIVRSARVSVSGMQDGDEDEDYMISSKDTGLINYLMREHHGTPFEQNSMTFYVKAPIFVFREFQRHRVGFSYNERSGRYSKLEPTFWLPSKDRPLVNVGSPAKPEMAVGSLAQWENTVNSLTRVYEVAWEEYENIIADGVTTEVARAVLPMGIYSEMYVTMNLRSAFSFLSLRTHDTEAKHVSRPQLEIEEVAREIEKDVAGLFPTSYDKFVEHGRVAP